MAAVLSSTPMSLSFRNYYRHEPYPSPTYSTMDRRTPDKMSLPSITTLIEDVDKQARNTPQRSPTEKHSRRTSGGSQLPPSPDRLSHAGTPRTQMPPTPPLPGTFSFDFPPRISTGYNSPAASGHTQTGYFNVSPSSTAPELYAHGRSSYPPVPDSTSQWTGANSHKSQRRPSDETSPFSARASPRSAYPDLNETNSPFPGLRHQRPLPADFPPPAPSPVHTIPAIDPQMTPQYQHHHQYPIGAQPAFPQSTDRYICTTCQKAFSRPSSLKIHTYSHTGEKPFQCKHEGCGKYFSVRSNMRRHEKGCHGGEGSSARGESPAASVS